MKETQKEQEIRERIESFARRLEMCFNWDEEWI